MFVVLKLFSHCAYFFAIALHFRVFLGLGSEQRFDLSVGHELSNVIAVLVLAKSSRLWLIFYVLLIYREIFYIEK